MTDMLAAALALAQRGLAVFPCKPRGKLPITRHGCLDATAELDVVRAWWRGGPELNIGIATGAKSGIWVLDVDGADGEASVRDLERRFGALPGTIEVITGSGGRHLYFRLPDFDEAPVIKNTASKIAPSLDTRGQGGYVVAPPSLHPCGRRYAWSVDSASEFADAPVWLLGLLTTPAPVTELDAQRPEDHWSNIIKDSVGEGRRNDTLARLAGLLLRRGFNASDTFDLCTGWNATHCNPPLSEIEVERTVRSIATREIARRNRPRAR